MRLCTYTQFEDEVDVWANAKDIIVVIRLATWYRNVNSPKIPVQLIDFQLFFFTLPSS